MGAIGLFIYNGSNTEAQKDEPFNTFDLSITIPKKYSTLQKEEEKFPIKFRSLGYPHSYSAFGTGIPSRLQRENAIAIIDSVFSANQIELKPNYPIKSGDGNFIADGYNADTKMGYVWLDGKNTASDCYRSWTNKIIILNVDDLLEVDQSIYKRQKKTFGDEGARDFLEKLSKKNYYKLILLKNAVSYKKKEFAKKNKNYIEKNKDYDSKHYGKPIFDEYQDQIIDLQEMKNIVNSNDHNIGTFSTYNYGYQFGLMKSYKTANGKIKYKSTGSQKALEKLANFVQEYIDWAKSEGRF